MYIYMHIVNKEVKIELSEMRETSTFPSIFQIVNKLQNDNPLKVFNQWKLHLLFKVLVF